jgi:tetratricopeptide (TPR) repeat protein
MRKVNSLFSIVLLILLVSQISYPEEKPNTQPSTNEQNEIIIRPLVDSRIQNSNIDNNIMVWLFFAKTFFSEQLDLNIRFLPTRQFELPEKFQGKSWHHHLQAEVMRDLTAKHKTGNEGLLVFVNATNDAGKTQNATGVSIVGINDINNQERFLFRKWLIVHELAHLFGADDVIDEHNIMDEDALSSVTSKTDSLMHFDETTIAIMKIIKEYLINNNRSVFTYQHVDLETGEKLVPLLNKNFSIMRKPASMYASLGEFYLSKGKYQKGLDNFSKAIEIERNNQTKGFQNMALDLTLYNQAICFYQLQQYESAIKAAQESIELGPPTPYPKHYMLGNAFKLLHDNRNDWTDEHIQYAKNIYKQSIQYFPNYYWNWFILAQIELLEVPVDEWNSEKVERVKSHLKKCLEIQPNSSYALVLLGTILSYQNHDNEANKLLKKAKELGLSQSFKVIKQGGEFYTKVY